MNENFPIEHFDTAYWDPDKLDEYDYDECPFCGGDVTEDAFEDERYDPHGCHEIEIHRFCEHCKNSWVEVYGLVRVYTDNN